MLVLAIGRHSPQAHLHGGSTLSPHSPPTMTPVCEPATIPDTSGNGGAIVREILTGSAADYADLRVGDRIFAIDGASILDPGQLFAAVVTHRPGASAVIEFTRAGRLMAVNVTLGGISP